jgi:glycosyltransferase involved in cell wall biosynthesis
MKIYIEASSFYGQRSGVGRYGLTVTEALMKQGAEDKLVLFNFLRPGRKIVIDFNLPKNASINHIRWLPGRFFSFLMRKGISLPLELFGLGRADILLFPNFISWPSLLRKKRVVVVHDVAFLYFPEFTQSKNLAYLRKQLRKSLQRASKIVTISESTKNDLIKEYSVPSDKITVVYCAVDHNIFNPKSSDQFESVLKKFNLPRDYFLFVGNLEPRKNLGGLLKAYSQSYGQHKTALVLVGGGKWAWNNSGFHDQLKQLENLPVYTPGFIDDDDLAALYTNAKAFVYPSFYEGFGIPPLEAMASGCPVICSNTSSLPEVVGNAAITLSPKDTEGLARAMVDVSSNESLRQKMIKDGLVRAKKFDWEKSANILSNVIDGLI